MLGGMSSSRKEMPLVQALPLLLTLFLRPSILKCSLEVSRERKRGRDSRRDGLGRGGIDFSSDTVEIRVSGDNAGHHLW